MSPTVNDVVSSGSGKMENFFPDLSLERFKFLNQIKIKEDWHDMALKDASLSRPEASLRAVSLRHTSPPLYPCSHIGAHAQYIIHAR